MSWSASTPVPVSADDLRAALESADVSGDREAAADQISAAIDAAVAIAQSGAIGSEKTFRASISGHANPDHEPADGFTNDQISVSVSQASPPAAE